MSAPDPIEQAAEVISAALALHDAIQRGDVEVFCEGRGLPVCIAFEEAVRTHRRGVPGMSAEAKAVLDAHYMQSLHRGECVCACGRGPMSVVGHTVHRAEMLAAAGLLVSPQPAAERDELDGLRAENERLRAEVARLGRLTVALHETGVKR